MGTREKLALPAILAIVTAILGGSTITFFASAIVKPAVDVQLSTFNSDDLKVVVKNTGLSPAKNLKLTIDSEWPITNSIIFSTENYTKAHQNNSNIFELFMKRLTQGDGTYVNLILATNTTAAAASHKSIAYATFDEGSLRRVISNVSGSEVNTSPSENLTAGVFVAIIAAFSTLVSGVITFISYSYNRKRIEMEKEKVRIMSGEGRNESRTGTALGTGGMSIHEFLEKLTKLFDQGIVTESEYNRIVRALAVSNGHMSLDEFLDKLKNLKK